MIIINGSEQFSAWKYSNNQSINQSAELIVLFPLGDNSFVMFIFLEVLQMDLPMDG